MSYRAYHDYDDDRDDITCVTLSDTRPMARKEHTCGGCKKTIPMKSCPLSGWWPNSDSPNSATPCRRQGHEISGSAA
jgi:hypothetical protein